MRHPFISIITAAVIISLTGCANENNGPEVPARSDCPDFTATIGGVQSRAFDRSWEQGDMIGVSGCARSNVCYHTANADGRFAVKNTGEQIYFQSNAEEDFVAYYPWNSLPAGTTAIKADTKAQTSRKNFDFLWATAKGKKDAPAVNLTFSHCMSKLVLTVKPGDDMSYTDIKSAKLSLDGFSHTGSFSTADGSTTVDAPAGPWTFSDLATLNDADGSLSFTFILFPQTHTAPLTIAAELDMAGNDKLSLRASVDFTGANRELDGSASRNEWKAGRQYNLSLTLHKTDIELDRCVINPWNEVSGDDISVD